MTDLLTPPIIDRFDGTEYAWLSNFHPAEVYYNCYKYPTVEHAYQAAKTTNTSKQVRMRFIATPGKAKAFGRTLPLRIDWEMVKLGIMASLLEQKFQLRTALGVQLLMTGDAELIEGNTWNDTFWGVCDGIGTNWLGRLLMIRRSQLFWFKGNK